MKKKGQTIAIVIILLVIIIIALIVIAVGLIKPTTTGETIKETKETIIIKEGVVCNSPYIQIGEECCLDKNKNNLCDNKEITECVTSSDCVNIQTTCCPCSMGGKNICVSKQDKNTIENYQKALARECVKDTLCIAEYNCKECYCVNNKCSTHYSRIE